MRYKPIDPSLFIENRRRLREQLKPGQVVVLKANPEVTRSRDTEYPYRQDSSFFWATGIDQSESILILNSDGETLYVRDATELEMVWIGPRLSLDEAQKISGVDQVKRLKEYKKPKVVFDASESIAHLRMIKQPQEIELMKKAIDITLQGFESAAKLVKAGAMEYEIEAELTQKFVGHGGDHAYNPIVAAGLNATILHYVKNNKALVAGEIVLIDSGAEYANYAADITRVFPVGGQLSERQQAVYDAVLRVKKYAESILKPGILIKEYEQQVGAKMNDELIELGLLPEGSTLKSTKSKPAPYRTFYPHGTSHFLGLDVHDVGDYSQPLKPGMVLTCEPGIYIREEGIGVRLEDDILITKDGSQNLSASIPI